MKVTPVASPHQVGAHISQGSNSTARAIEAFNKASAGATQGNIQEHPVPNANNISPEDVIKAQSLETQDISTTSEDTSEIPKVEEKPEKDPALKRQFEQLARQERLLRQKATQQQQEIKAREDALSAREAALNAKSTEDRSNYVSRDRVKQDALSVLAEAGVSYEDLTQQIISQVPTDPRVNATISRLEAKIQELEGKTQAFETNSKQAQAEAYQSAVRQLETDTKQLIKADPVSFEAISKTPGADKEVVKLIEAVWQKDGVLMSVEEAANEIENELVERSMKSYTQIEKLKKRIQESSTKAIVEEKTAQNPKTQSPMKTLTNNVSSTRQLSAKERAMLAFKGELK